MLTQFRQAAGHRLVVGKAAVAVQFRPVRKAALDIIERVGSFDVASNLNALPGREIIINFAPGCSDLGLDRLDFVVEIEGVLIRVIPDFLQAPL